MALSTDLEKRIVDFTRKSDSKVYPAEVRQVPSRFVSTLSGQEIVVGYIDAEDEFKQKSATLTYADDTTAPWDWENDDFKCTYVLPEVIAEVETQTERGPSPILEKGTKMTVTSSF